MSTHSLHPVPGALVIALLIPFVIALSLVAMICVPLYPQFWRDLIGRRAERRSSASDASGQALATYPADAAAPTYRLSA